MNIDYQPLRRRSNAFHSEEQFYMSEFVDSNQVQQSLYKQRISFKKKIQAQQSDGESFEEGTNFLNEFDYSLKTSNFSFKQFRQLKMIPMRFKLPQRNNIQFRSIKEFKLGKKIGEGAFSKVYEVTHYFGGRKFAMKIINFDRLGTLDQENVQKEIEAHKKFNHENIIKLIDFFQEGKKVYMVLELCENGNLFQRLKNKKEIVTLNDLKKFYRQTCHALQYIHNKKYIMRDIKPENLLIDKNNNIKLCDFGWIADLTIDNEFRKIKAGTFAYMSPESLQGQLQDIPSDIWALGILLYELFHLKDPYRTISCQQQLQCIQNQRIEFNYKRIPTLAQNLVLKILKYDVKKRPSIQEILNDEFFFKQCDDPREIYEQTPIDQYPHLKDLYWDPDQVNELFKEPKNLIKKYEKKKDLKKENQKHLKEIGEKFGVQFNGKKQIKLNLQTSFSYNNIPVSQNSSKNSDNSSQQFSTHSEPVNSLNLSNQKSYDKLSRFCDIYNNNHNTFQKVGKKQRMKIQASSSNIRVNHNKSGYQFLDQDQYNSNSKSFNRSQNKYNNLGSTPQKVQRTNSSRRIIISKQLSFDHNFSKKKNFKKNQKNYQKDLSPIQKQMNFKKKKKQTNNDQQKKVNIYSIM